MNYFLFLFIFNTLSHYEGNSHEVIRINEISSVQCYNYDIIDGEILDDSTLTVERRFNKGGYATEIIIHEYKGEVGSLYEYEYKEDSILQKRRTYSGLKDSLLETTIVSYNEKGKNVAFEHFGPKGEKLKLGSSMKYDNDGSLSRRIVEEDNEVIAKENYAYRLDGKLSEVITKSSDKETYKLYYDMDGKLISIYQWRKKNGRKGRRFIQELEYDLQGRLVKTRSCNYKTRKIIGVGGVQIAKGVMEIIREIDYNGNGTIFQEREFSNRKLTAVKKYFYKYSL